MSEFNLRCVILDDTPEGGVQKTVNWLANVLGCEVLTLATPDEVRSRVDALTDAHIVLCDLTFNNFKELGDPAFIPSELGKNRKEFVTDWIRAIQRWNSSTDKEAWPSINVPGAQIGSSEVGFWLAALVSQINPDCEIVFYTSAQKQITGALSAIARFRGSRFGVDTKNPDTEVSPPAIQAALKRRQRTILQTSPHVYKWFLRGVFLPSLLNRPTAEGKAIQLSVCEPDREFVLKADSFFPQLKAAATSFQERIDFLSQFLIKERWQLQPWESRALHSLEHDLRPGALDGFSKALPQEQSDCLERLLVLAMDAGTVGQGVLAILEVARAELQQKGSWPSHLLQSAYKLCQEGVRNSERDLANLCHALQTKPSESALEVDAVCAIEPGSTGDKTDPRLPFPVAYLRRVAAALKHNLGTSRVGQTQKQNLQFSLSAKIEEASLCIEWQDNSRGFCSMDAFRDAVTRSLSKIDAEHRGLPMAILFGVEFGAASVEVLVEASTPTIGHEWHLIYPACTEARVSLSREQRGFAIRWTFPHLGCQD